MNKISMGLKGRYKLIVRKQDGSVARETDWFDNLITDAGLNRIGSGGFEYCHVGSGSNAPSVLDTGLQTFIGSTAAVHDRKFRVDATGEKYGACIRTYRFAAGVATGNISEVGISWTNTTGNLFSRALVLDGLGSPISITVLSDEVLDVVYELRLYPPMADKPVSFTMGGVTHTGTLRIMSFFDYALGATNQAWCPTNLFTGFISSGITFNVTNYRDAALVATTATTIIGTAVGSKVAQLKAYSNNSLKLGLTVSFSLTESNHANGITGIQLNTSSCFGNYQIVFAPAIMKDATKTMTLNLEVSWARKVI